MATTEDMFTDRWLRITFKTLVNAARKKGVDPKNVSAFVKFLRESRNDRINWGGSIVDKFAQWAGEEYAGFVEDVSG